MAISGKPGGPHDDAVDPNAPTIKMPRREDVDPYADTLKAPSPDQDKTVRYGKPSNVPGAEARPLPVGWLVVVKGPGEGHAATIQAGNNSIGRSPDSDIVLDFGDRQIAREKHVRVIYNRVARTFHLAPGEGPETWLKGELIMQPEKLERGDLVTVGGTVLRFAPFCDETFDWSGEEGR